eukprot:766034-Hanusia_phi.AAC.5
MDYGNIGDEGGLVRKPYSIKDFDDGGKPCQGMLWDSLYSSRRGDEATFGQGEAMSYRGDMDVEIAGMHTHIAKVVVAHQATAPNQISLQMGELVEVQTGNGAWSLGRVLNEDRKGARDGWFPTFCISSLTENLMHESSTVPLPSESDLISAEDVQLDRSPCKHSTRALVRFPSLVCCDKVVLPDKGGRSLKGPKKVGPNDPTREELLGPLPSAHTQTFVRQRKSDISAYAHEKKDSADAQRCFKARHMSHSFSEPMRRQGNPLTDLHALVSSSKILLHQEELFPNASFSAKSRGRSHSVGIDYQRVRSDMAEVSLQDSKKSAVKDLGETELYPSFML